MRFEKEDLKKTSVYSLFGCSGGNVSSVPLPGKQER